MRNDPPLTEQDEMGAHEYKFQGCDKKRFGRQEISFFIFSVVIIFIGLGIHPIKQA